MKKQKIALVHDYMNEAGGAERVLRVLSEMYPEAPIYTSFVKRGSASEMFSDRKVIESEWGWFLKIGRFFSLFRFLLPFIWRSIDLSDYDVVITSCSGYIARGFKTGEKTRVVAYCHTPPKWLYGYETPTNGRRRWWGALYLAVFGPFVRYFDYISAQRVDLWIANSQEVANRIKKFYRKEAIVEYPPIVRTREHANMRTREKYYLTVARMVGAKGLEEAARGCKQAKRKLIVVGERVSPKLKIKNSKYVEYLGRVSDKELADLYKNARGYIALARDEDFGMTVVEAMSYGTPVIARNSGGYRETVGDKSQITNDKSQIFSERGILISDEEELPQAMERLEKTKWDREKIMTWAKKFNRERFEKEIKTIMNHELRIKV